MMFRLMQQNTKKKSKNSLIGDIAINMLGKGVSVALLLVCTPLFLRYAGVEGYALISFAVTLQAVVVLLDLGLGMTLNRLVSTEQHGGFSPGIVAASFRLEKWCLGISAVCSVLAFVVLPIFIPTWLKLSSDAVFGSHSVMFWMTAAIVAQLPVMFYTNGLNAVDRQKQANWILVVFSFAKYGGSVWLLYVGGTMDLFFSWQAAVNLGLWIMMRFVFWHHVKSQINFNEERVISLRGHVPFAAGIAFTALFGAMLTQLDKFLLSRWLSLDEFAYYMLAWTLCSGVFMSALPVTTACFPRLTASIVKDSKGCEAVFRSGCQFIIAAAIPVAAMLVVFPDQILALWSGEHVLGNSLGKVVGLLAVGAVLNVLCQMPHALLLAHGQSRIGVLANALMVVFTVPMLYIFVTRFGLFGAGLSWVALNAGYFLIGTPLIFHWLLPHAFRHWCFEDVVIPVTASFAPLIIFSAYFPITSERSMVSFTLLSLAYLTSLLVCCISMHSTRSILWSFWLSNRFR